MKLIVGLGNPGKKYERTFHNVGFMVLQQMADIMEVKIKKKECQSLTAEFFVSGERIVLACPQTFMNLSGQAVVELMGRYKADLSDLLIVYDDADLEVGELRLRLSGSAGTHNGMRNIIFNLDAQEFKRLRVGIGKPPQNIPIADYVLGNIPASISIEMKKAVFAAAEAALKWTAGWDFDKVMQEYNGRV